MARVFTLFVTNFRVLKEIPDITGSECNKVSALPFVCCLNPERTVIKSHDAASSLWVFQSYQNGPKSQTRYSDTYKLNDY